MKKPQCSVMIPDPIKTDEKRHCLLPSLSFSGPCRKHANLPAPGKDVCAELCQRKILTDENTRLKEQVGKAKADVLETAQKEFITSCSAQEDMMVLVRRWEARIEDFHSKGRERVT